MISDTIINLNVEEIIEKNQRTCHFQIRNKVTLINDRGQIIISSKHSIYNVLEVIDDNYITEYLEHLAW